MKTEEKRKQEAITVPRIRRARPQPMPSEPRPEPRFASAIEEAIEADLWLDARYER